MTNTCVLDLFLTVLILMVQKKLFYEGREEAFFYKLEDLFNMEYPMDMNLDKDQYRGNTALTLLKKASDT
jgi:hypothetical protein